MHARNPNTFAAAHARHVNVAMLSQRLIELRNLVTLWQVGIEVILAGEDAGFIDAAIQRHGREHRELDCFLIENRKRARQAEAHWADVRVGRSAEARGASAENFRFSQQLDVNFEADDWLVFLAYCGADFGRG